MYSGLVTYNLHNQIIITFHFFYFSKNKLLQAFRPNKLSLFLK